MSAAHPSWCDIAIEHHHVNDPLRDDSEQSAVDCGFCPYGIEYHVLTPGGFVCPTEAEARERSGAQ